MKKISAITLLSILALPAFAADEIPNPIIDSVARDVAENVSAQIVKGEVAVQNLETTATSAATTTANDTVKSYVEKSRTAFPHGVQVGVGVSATGGLNGFIGYANKDFDSFWAKRFGVRLDFASTKPIRSVMNDAINEFMGDGLDIGDGLTISDGELDATHYAALVDFYPFGDTWLLGGWRLTGGYAFGDMSMSASVAGTIDGLTPGYYEFELSGKKYAYTGNGVHGTAKLDWEYRGPYLGTGFDIGLFAGLKIYLDAGVVFTNRAAELSLDIPTDNLQQWNGTSWDSINVSELDTVIEETLADAQDELNDYKFYPLVKLGFMYRF
ncbi:MAG: hypothetical protein IKW57_02240 [Alphaproteobacteria bacterium]|nr:hypothetical protein [Alphaproteobacteria bacterium]